ncbi:MAG: universal stress protein [Planctomycetaceae bacterium]|jgi:nucleotide-binding universal stress UspA family protein|nr:universal stress protein [Planctomycetaceae bacterium]
MTWSQEKLIVVPTDMSDFSFCALKTACKIAERRDLIRVIHVMSVLEPIDPEAAWVIADEPMRLEQTRKEAEEFLMSHDCGDLPFEIRVGNAGTEIADYATEIHAGLIIIPSHGRGVLTRLLLGSTTDRVVHLSPCPVLVLKKDSANVCSKSVN